MAASRRWQSADGWWRDTAAALRELRAALAGDEIRGLSLSGRGGAAVFADAAGTVVADPWSDSRHAEQQQALRDWRRVNDVRLSNAGLGLIAKFRWLVAHAPEQAALIERGFFGKDWLLFRLTGRHLTDPVSGPDSMVWSDSLAALELPPYLLPETSMPWELAGTVSAAASEATGIPAGTPVAVGAHDGLCANIGAGAVNHGQYALTLGTHAVVRAVQDVCPAGAYRFYGFPPDKHVIGGNALLAGRSADWFLDLLGAEGGEETVRDYTVHEDQAAAAAPGASGVRFLPFLAGQVSPELREDARGLFAGLALKSDSADLYRAVLEGSTFAVRLIFDQVVDWCGAPAMLRATGGGSESALWMRIVAAVLDQPIEVTGLAVEGRGAAVCLAVALGHYPDLQTAVTHMVQVRTRIEPDPTWRDIYSGVFEDWSRLNDLNRGYQSAPGEGA